MTKQYFIHNLQYTNPLFQVLRFGVFICVNCVLAFYFISFPFMRRDLNQTSESRFIFTFSVIVHTQIHNTLPRWFCIWWKRYLILSHARQQPNISKWEFCHVIVVFSNTMKLIIILILRICNNSNWYHYINQKLPKKAIAEPHWWIKELADESFASYYIAVMCMGSWNSIIISWQWRITTNYFNNNGNSKRMKLCSVSDSLEHRTA